MFLIFFLSFIPGFLTRTVTRDVELNGFVEVDHISYLKNKDSQKVNMRNQGILQLKLSGSLNEQSAFHSEVEFREDQADSKRNRIFLKEAYVSLYASDFDLQLGKQIIPWGKADYINPTDNISPWDYTDILDTEDEQIGVVSFLSLSRTSIYSGSVHI